jgi:hypothetical protein
VLATVSRQIALPVTVDVQPPHYPPTLNGSLPDPGVDRLSMPRDVARQTHIDRKQACHRLGGLPRLKSAKSSEPVSGRKSSGRLAGSGTGSTTNGPQWGHRCEFDVEKKVEEAGDLELIAKRCL